MADHTLLIAVQLRDGTTNMRRAIIPDEMFPVLREQLLHADEIKAAWIYEQREYIHKSFADDFDPAKLMDVIANHPDEVRRAIGLAQEMGAAVDARRSST